MSRGNNDPAVIDDNAEPCLMASAKSPLLEELDDNVEELGLRTAQEKVDLSREKVVEDDIEIEAMTTNDSESSAENLGYSVKDLARMEQKSLDNDISATRESEMDGEMSSRRLVRAAKVVVGEEEGADKSGAGIPVGTGMPAETRNLVGTQEPAARRVPGKEVHSGFDARQVIADGKGLFIGNARQGFEKIVKGTQIDSRDGSVKVEDMETAGSNTDSKEIKADGFPTAVEVEADFAKSDISSSGFVSDNRIFKLNPGANKTLMEKNSQSGSPDCNNLHVNSYGKAAENHSGSPANTPGAVTSNVDKCIEGSRGCDFAVAIEDYDVDDIAAKLETMDFAFENVAGMRFVVILMQFG